MKKFLMFLCAVMMVFGMVGSASAVSFTNGSFETGDFTDWDVTEIAGGTASVATDVLGFNATEGIYFADLTATSLIEQGIQTWDAGETFSVDWNFISNDTWPYNDYSILYIFDCYYNLLDVVKLADVISVGFGGSFTGWNTLEYTFASAGSGYIGFGVFNAADGMEDSQLFIDNIISGAAPVPEPSTILLLGSGLLGLVGYGRKRFSKKS